MQGEPIPPCRASTGWPIPLHIARSPPSHPVSSPRERQAASLAAFAHATPPPLRQWLGARTSAVHGGPGTQLAPPWGSRHLANVTLLLSTASGTYHRHRLLVASRTRPSGARRKRAQYPSEPPILV